jgi:predicted transcriptional regulator
MARRGSFRTLGLGPLEAEIMRVLWRRGPSLAGEIVKALNRRRPEPLAYSTVANVLSNLEAKDVVGHTVEGRAFRFAPMLSEAELRAREARSRTRGILDLFAGEAVSAFVSEVRSDPALNEEFQKLLEEGDDEGGRS